MNEIAVQESRDVLITDEQTELIKRTICQGATDQEMQLFFYDCKRRGVHPLDKLIHFTKRSNKYTPITSIDFMRQRAHGSGVYAGEDEPLFERGPNPDIPPVSCTYSVYRLVGNMRCKWTATARWKEYYPGDQLGFMWKKMPYLMLAKCAEALALRKAFPAELQGLYVHEEMEQATPEVRRGKPSPYPLEEERQEDGAAISGLSKESPTHEIDGPQQGSDAPAPAGFIWRVGSKHKNESITTMPDDYLEWFTKEGKNQEHVQAALDELDRRRGQGRVA